MNRTLSLLVITLAAVLTACSHKISPDKPQLAVTDFRLDSLPDSEINIPIRISLNPVYAMAEKQVDTLFTSPGFPEGWVMNGCDTRYKYSFRRSPLQLKAAGNSFSLGFTGYYRIIGSTRVCVAGAAVSPWTAPCSCGFDEPERRVNISFTNTISLHPDYRMKLLTRRNEPQALDKCEMCFWGMDVTRQVLSGLTSELDAAKAELDKSYGSVDLKPQFLQLWDQLGKAYKLPEMGWLQVNPQRLRVNNFYAKGDSLYAYLGLTARPVISSIKPVDQSAPLPNLAPYSRDNGFSVFLDAMLDYDSLSTVINRLVVNKEFDFKKGPVRKKFIIRECRLYGSGNEKLIIRIDFGGTDNGTVYLTGKPVYTKDTRILEVKDLEFDIRSKDALLKTAEWLFSRKIINEISRNARFDLGHFIDSAKVDVNRQLNQEWVKGISSEGSITQIQLIGIYPLGKALVIRSNCSGVLAMKVDTIDFSL
ncbi:MAG: DUF4403 family protein [Chitinophagaceae bacterium]|nr:MAG: DUF4403 family protein [Chitinophagaceae bacterium]